MLLRVSMRTLQDWEQGHRQLSGKLYLGEIWDYTFSQWGVEQAEKNVRELWSDETGSQ